MSFEQPPQQPQEPLKQEPREEEELPVGAPKRPIGPLSDYFEPGGPKFYPETTAERAALLEKIAAPRNPSEEVRVSEERGAIAERLAQVNELLEEQQRGEAPQAGEAEKKPAAQEETVEKLERAKEKLEREEKQLDLAEEFNDVLDDFARLSKEDLARIEQTGETKEGKAVRTKAGKELHRDIAKQLAYLSRGGIRRLTWGMLDKLSQVVDAILRDIISAVKGVFKGPERGKR